MTSARSPEDEPGDDHGPSEYLAYRGKHFTVPALAAEGFTLEPRPDAPAPVLSPSPILDVLNQPFDVKNFLTARRPLHVGHLDAAERTAFSRRGMPRTLDMPIKFPGSAFRVPAAFEQLRPVLQRVADFERAVNPGCYDEYYCYLTVDQGTVRRGVLQREAPCHVDGFQGARWRPKVRGNHTYVISDAIPTAYYQQPFDLGQLDEAKHNFFWEMNRQVALTSSAHVWRPAPYELDLMDCYTVHRGDVASEDTFRTWVRMSFEVRIFDRLGNAKNPLFRYDWPMVPRDIEGLGLVAWDETSDPSLRVFPWQKPDGTPYEDPRARTQPNLRPR